MGSEKFCLRWNDFENNISQAFRDLRQDEDFFDCTIACEDDQIPAHKVILSACSVFFKDVLRKNPHAHPLVYMKGVRMRELVSLVNFMYHGEVNVAQDELNGFLSVAEDLKVKGLTQSTNSGGHQEKPLVFSDKSPHFSDKSPHFSDKSPQSHKSPQLSPGYRNTEPPQIKKQKVSKSFTASPSNQELSAKSHRVTPTGGRKAIAVKSEPEARHQDAALDTSHISDHSDQYGHGDYEYAGYGEGGDTQEDTDYGNAVAVVDDQSIENQAMQDNGNTASEITKLIEQYLVRLEDPQGSLWACTACDKQSRVKHHLREHIEVNHIDCLTFTCPYCKAEQKNRVSLRSHISKRHREEHKLQTFNSNQNRFIKF